MNKILELVNNGLGIHFNDHIAVIILMNIFFLIASYTDIKDMKIYDKFNKTMLIVRIITFFIFSKYQDQHLKEYLLGGMVMFISFLLVGMFSNTPIGGDIKFSANMGLWLGFSTSITLVAILIIVNLLFRLIVKIKGRVPLAPFFYVSYILLGIYYFTTVL